jgi:hypothetical protein
LRGSSPYLASGAVALTICSSGVSTGCAPSRRAVTSAPATSEPAAAPAPSPRPAAALDPQWQDVFFETPEFLVVVRPKSLREDRIYGPLFRQAVRLARDRSKVVTATRMVESMEDAEEVILGVTEAGERPAEVVLVMAGVRADVDPAKLVDDDGAVLWTAGPPGPLRELVREKARQHGDDDPDASLFELPGRTWVVASGAARNRARDVFAHPLNRPRLAYDPQALALVRIDGPSLVSHVHQLRGPGALSPVGHGLVSTLLSLPPGADHALRVVLDYAGDDDAFASEAALRQTFSALGRSQVDRLAWLGDARVERTRRSVVATAPLPPKLIDALLSAGGANVPARP